METHMQIARGWKPFIALGIATVAMVAPLPAEERDFDAIAANVVQHSLELQPGEVVLINGNPENLELMAALQVAVTKAGGQPILTISLPEATKRALLETPVEHLGQLPTANLLLARIADASITVTSVADPTLFADVPEERLAVARKAVAPLNAALSRIRIRSVSLGQTGGIPTAEYAASVGADATAIGDMFWRAVAVPPAQLASRTRAVASQLTDGTRVRVTSAAGTDLQLTIAAVPARVNAGRAADVATATGGSSAWLPAGEAYACVLPGSATGTVVVPHTQVRGVQLANVRLTVERGRITGVTADDHADLLQAQLAASSPESSELSILDIGVNPESRSPEGSRYYSWEMDGMVSLVFGNNTWAGCDNMADGGVSFHLPGATANIGGKPILASSHN
jgi:aminopeptidase